MHVFTTKPLNIGNSTRINVFLYSIVIYLNKNSYFLCLLIRIYCIWKTPYTVRIYGLSAITLYTIYIGLQKLVLSSLHICGIFTRLLYTFGRIYWCVREPIILIRPQTKGLSLHCWVCMFAYHDLQ